MADVVFVAGRSTTAEEINDEDRQEATTARYQGILGVSEDPLVSADIIGGPHAAVVDLDMTRSWTARRSMSWPGTTTSGASPPDGPGGPSHPRRDSGALLIAAPSTKLLG
jgi:Glyceraldehyde 3-phosphate dehydrogenase, C-terminal domain